MKLGSRIVLMAGLAIFAGACAGAGGAPEPVLSPTGEPFPEGIPPRDNEYTQRAELSLIQAAQLEEANPEQAQQRYREALEAAMQGIEHDPENAESYFQAGRAHLGLRNYEEADALLDQAEELYPAFYVEIEPIREAYWVETYNAAIEEVGAGNVEAAIELFERAAFIYDRRPEGHLNLGSLYAQVADYDAAIRAYQRAIEITRDADPQLFDEETIDAWRENEHAALLNMAQLLSHTGRFEEAARAYESYLERNPDDIAARSNLAVALMNMDETEAALAIYDDLLARPDLSGQDYSSIGVGLFQVEAYDRAAEAFSNAVERHPNSRDDVYNWAQTLFLLEDWDRFLPVVERLAELDPYNHDVYRLYAHGLVQTGDEQEAVRQMERMEALPFELVDLGLQLMGAEGAQVLGSLYNVSLEPGTPVQIRIYFIGPDGNDVGSRDVQLQAPGIEETTGFQAMIEGERIVGYRYEVLSH